jgi:uncharacterized repeat protein (TIGR03943 family)
VSPAGGTISVLVGAVLLRLTLTGAYTRYVQGRMGPWLVVAGVVVIALGLATLVRSRRSDDGQHADEHADEHGERIGWLLLAPIAALLLVAPPALGSYGVDRGATVDVRSGAPEFQRLDARGGPASMTLLEFNQRAFDHDGSSFGDAPVQLTGFVAEGGGAGGFRLARYEIACCAADAAPVVVRVVGTDGDPPARDRWVTVTGTFRPGGGDTPQLAATSVVEIPEPSDPYE